MTVSKINRFYLLLTVVKRSGCYTTLTITKNSSMQIKLEAALFIVGVKTYSGEEPSHFKTNFFCGPITVVFTIIVTSLSP